MTISELLGLLDYLDDKKKAYEKSKREAERNRRANKWH